MPLGLLQTGGTTLNKRRITTTTAGIAAAALYLTGCSGSGNEAVPTGTQTVTATASPEPTIVEPQPPTTTTATSSLTPRPEGPPVLSFGEAFEYSDGVSVNVTNLGTQYVTTGAESSGGQVVELQLAITNNTGAAWDPTGASGTLTYGAEGISAEQVYNSENGWSGGYFTGTLLPGRTATVSTAYAVPNAGVDDLVFEFNPEFGFDRGAVIYLSQP